MDAVRDDDLRFPGSTTGEDGALPGVCRRPGDRRTVLAYALAVLFPAAVVAAVVTLLVMAGSAAAATGGCGGG